MSPFVDATVAGSAPSFPGSSRVSRAAEISYWRWTGRNHFRSTKTRAISVLNYCRRRVNGRQNTRLKNLSWRHWKLMINRSTSQKAACEICHTLTPWKIVAYLDLFWQHSEYVKRNVVNVYLQTYFDIHKAYLELRRRNTLSIFRYVEPCHHQWYTATQHQLSYSCSKYVQATLWQSDALDYQLVYVHFNWECNKFWFS